MWSQFWPAQKTMKPPQFNTKLETSGGNDNLCHANYIHQAQFFLLKSANKLALEQQINNTAQVIKQSNIAANQNPGFAS
jgi:hypothetical protein